MPNVRRHTLNSFCRLQNTTAATALCTATSCRVVTALCAAAAHRPVTIRMPSRARAGPSRGAAARSLAVGPPPASTHPASSVPTSTPSMRWWPPSSTRPTLTPIGAAPGPRPCTTPGPGRSLTPPHVRAVSPLAWASHRCCPHHHGGDFFVNCTLNLSKFGCNLIRLD
jgi:hypothetical protein